MRIARAASSDYGLFLAVGLTLSLVAPALVMAAGILGLMPLTGVVTPFMSYGGSAMATNFAALGLLAAMASDRSGIGRRRDAVPSALALVGWRTRDRRGRPLDRVAGRVQVMSADDSS